MSVSIEVNNEYIYIAEGELNGKNVKVEKHLKLPILEDSVDDGLIKDVDYIADFIKSAIDKNGIKTKEITFILSTSNLISRHLSIPMARQSEMLNMVKMEVLQSANASINYFVDYSIIDTVVQNKIKYAQLVAYAVDEKYVIQFVNIAKKLNLKLKAIDVADNAIDKALHLCNINEDKDGFIVAKINSTNMLIILYENGKPTFSKVELFTNQDGSQMDTNESGELNDKGELKIIKYFSGGYVAEKPSITEEENVDVYEELIENKIYSICNYISKVLKYFYTKNGSSKMGKIFILGEGTYIEKIDEKISDYFGLPVLKIENPAFVKSDNKIDFSVFIDSIGGIIRR